MSDMIERVEAVISEKLMATWSSASPLAKAALRQLSTTLARAAIEAMREPTAGVMRIVREEHGFQDASIYSKFIDAALKGEAE